MSVLLLLISLSMDAYLRQMTISGTEIEEAQLARAVLEKMARDLRSTLVPPKTEELEVDTDALASVWSLTGVSDTLDALSLPADVGTVDDEEAGTYGTMPGIYGDLNWIQIDSAQLPRGEMFGAKQVRSGSILTDRLSPSKTILYYLGKDTGQVNWDDPLSQPENLTGSLGRSRDSSALQCGLFRRHMDRMVSQYALNEGTESEWEQYDEPLAPEIENMEFAYFDPEAGQSGSAGEWVETWDMDERQMLPLAVRVTIFIRKEPNSRRPVNQTAEPETVVYSVIVPLPLSLEVPTDTESDTLEE